MIERQIEKIKTDLSLNPYFNREGAFRLFELDGRGYIDKDDLKYWLNLIGIFPTDYEFDIVVPFEKENRTMVEERLPH